jgi:pimeloyl-ACP methyl ester carboxylesterase
MRHLDMDEERTILRRWSGRRVVLGLGLTAATVLGILLLLHGPPGSHVASPVAPTDQSGVSVVGDPRSDVDSASASRAEEVTGPVGSDADTSDTDGTLASPVAVDTPVLVDLVDASRSTVSGGVTIDEVRRLPTTVWHPISPGPHPLVVFAHGYQVGPMTYARFCTELASHGYVVAAPSFPLADESRGNGLDREDIPNQAIDVDFVITTLRAGDPSISSEPVAVIGHSDGATVALLVAERPDAMNAAIGAVVAIAPDALFPPLTDSPPPLLIIHGTDDPIAAFADAQGDFDRFLGHRWLLALEGADHLPPIVGDTPWTPVLDQAVEVFLATTVRSGPRIDAAALTAALEQLDLSHVTTAG